MADQRVYARTFSQTLTLVAGPFCLEKRVSYRRLRKEFDLDDEILSGAIPAIYQTAIERQDLVESECGAVAVGRTYLLPPLSSDGASLVRPWLRFHTPLIGRVEDWRAGLARCRATSPVPSTSNAACGF
jgi:hypothetical protein